MTFPDVPYSRAQTPRIFYSWTIVAPFFGFLHDVSGSYTSSFVLFVIAVVISAFSILWVRAPEK